MSAQHTPGPWRVPTGYSDFQVHGPDGVRVADVFTLDRHAAECEANARLIAAAPDLRAVTGELYRLLCEWRRTPFFDQEADWQQWVDDFGARVDSATDAAMAAINKAEGREL